MAIPSLVFDDFEQKHENHQNEQGHVFYGPRPCVLISNDFLKRNLSY
jgi:mRNA-degrading endonuclease toxin of MazEF toxin-antitoxin module